MHTFCFHKKKKLDGGQPPHPLPAKWCHHVSSTPHLHTIYAPFLTTPAAQHGQVVLGNAVGVAGGRAAVCSESASLQRVSDAEAMWPGTKDARMPATEDLTHHPPPPTLSRCPCCSHKALCTSIQARRSSSAPCVLSLRRCPIIIIVTHPSDSKPPSSRLRLRRRHERPPQRPRLLLHLHPPLLPPPPDLGQLCLGQCVGHDLYPLVAARPAVH